MRNVAMVQPGTYIKSSVLGKAFSWKFPGIPTGSVTQVRGTRETMVALEVASSALEEGRKVIWVDADHHYAPPGTGGQEHPCQGKGAFKLFHPSSLEDVCDLLLKASSHGGFGGLVIVASIRGRCPQDFSNGDYSLVELEDRKAVRKASSRQWVDLFCNSDLSSSMHSTGMTILGVGNSPLVWSEFANLQLTANQGWLRIAGCGYATELVGLRGNLPGSRTTASCMSLERAQQLGIV